MDNQELVSKQKKYLNEMLERDLKEKVKKVRARQSEIENSDSLPMLLVAINDDVISGRDTQSEVKVNLIIALSNSDFFKKAEYKRKTNEVTFTLDEYSISFPLTYLLSIKVDKEKQKTFLKKPYIDKRILKIHNIYTAYMKDEINFESLLSFYKELNGIKTSIFSRFKKQKIHLHEVLSFFDEYLDIAEEYFSELEDYNEEQEYINGEKERNDNFMNSVIEDLKPFSDERFWTVNIYFDTKFRNERGELSYD